ncbi:MAG: DUF1232 domain-containing protein [Bauldia sp.]|nr:DUF1232 domain-containing protein [Bauldia sp.]
MGSAIHPPQSTGARHAPSFRPPAHHPVAVHRSRTGAAHRLRPRALRRRLPDGQYCPPAGRVAPVTAIGSAPPASRFARLRQWARAIKRDVIALYLAARDPRVPWYAKALSAAVAAYALSPIDLIPDFIPVLGYLDDLIIVPLGILAAVRLIPPTLMAEHRAAAAEIAARPVSRTGAAVIIIVWIAAALLVALLLLR